MCVWVSGASLDSLSPGSQHRHRGRLRHVSLPPRRSQAELSHVSAKRELTLNRDVEAESIQRRVAASTRRAWSNIATQHDQGCIAASPRTARGRRLITGGRPVGAWAWRRRLRARAEPPRGRASGRAPRGLVCSLLLDVPPRGASLSYFTYLYRRRGGMLRKKCIDLSRRAKAGAGARPREHTHRCPTGATVYTERCKMTLTARRPQSESPHSAGHQVTTHATQLCTD